MEDLSTVGCGPRTANPRKDSPLPCFSLLFVRPTSPPSIQHDFEFSVRIPGSAPPMVRPENRSRQSVAYVACQKGRACVIDLPPRLSRPAVRSVASVVIPNHRNYTLFSCDSYDETRRHFRRHPSSLKHMTAWRPERKAWLCLWRGCERALDLANNSSRRQTSNLVPFHPAVGGST